MTAVLPRSLAGLDRVDIHEVDYCALNCRAGITAAMVAAHGVDLAPLFAGLAIDPRAVMGPIARGEIAGFTFGSVDDETWRDLFAVEFEAWHPTSCDDMVSTLRDALDSWGPVLAARDGFYDPLAADKFGRHHVTHNSMVYGIDDDGRFLIADRTYRTTMDADVLWAGLEPDGRELVAVRRAAPASARHERVAAGAAKLAVALGAQPGDVDLARLAGALAADVEQPEGRWLQSHAFFRGVGRSRALFAAAVQGTDLGDPRTTAALAHADEAWGVLAHHIYKRVHGRRLVGPEALRPLVDAALDADGAARDALAQTGIPARP